MVDLERELIDLEGFGNLDRDLYAPTITELNRLTQVIESQWTLPRPLIHESRLRWTYDSPGLEHILVQRLYRAISGLNACRFLLPNCFTTEIAVILRTVNEFNEDIVFLLENYGSPLSKDQELFIRENIKPIYRNPNVSFEGLEKKAMVPRERIIAANRRRISPLSNPSDAQKLSDVTGDLLSSYVHGAFEANLEMYGHDLQNPRYEIDGSKTDRARFEWVQQVLVQLERIVFSVEYLGQVVGPISVHAEAGTLRRSYSKIAVRYGYWMEFENKNMLGDIKKGKPLRPRKN